MKDFFTMTTKNRTIKVYLTILALATAAASGLRTAALIKDFNFTSGHFDGKSLITAASLIAVAISLAMVTYVFFSDKSKGYVAEFSTPLTYVPAGAVCTAAFFFLLNIKEAIPKLSEVSKATPITELLLLIIFYLLFPTIAYFILTSVTTDRASSARALCGISTVICFALYTSYLYFDTALTINNPNKIIDEMAFLLASLFFLYETRISISRESWNLYFVTGAIASGVGLYSSIPAIIATVMRNRPISESVEENVLMLTVAVFIFARLMLSATYIEDKRSEAITMLRDAALEREAFICEREEMERQVALENAYEGTVINESLFIDSPTPAESNDADNGITDDQIDTASVDEAIRSLDDIEDTYSDESTDSKDHEPDSPILSASDDEADATIEESDFSKNESAAGSNESDSCAAVQTLEEDI